MVNDEKPSPFRTTARHSRNLRSY